MDHRPRRRIPPIVTLAIAVVAPLPSAPSLDEQTASDGRLFDPLELVVVPFAGVPNVRGSSDQGALGTVGVRAALPMIPPAYPGASAVQLWFDLRAAFPGMRSLRAGDPTLWGQIMLAFVLPVHLGH